MLRLQLDGTGSARGENGKWSPVKGTRQEVGGRAEPAHAFCDGADARDSLVLLLGWTLLLGQVVWDVRVLLHHSCWILLEGYHQLGTKGVKKSAFRNIWIYPQMKIFWELFDGNFLSTVLSDFWASPDPCWPFDVRLLKQTNHSRLLFAYIFFSFGTTT